MTEQTQQKRGVLYVIVCAAGPAQQVQDFVIPAQVAGWEVCIIPTPNAVPFLDIPLLTKLTGRSVRSEYRAPDTSETFPPCDALVVVAATFNTINKLALGIADTRALTILSENLGREQPILVVPCVNQNHLARHPAFHQSLATLEAWGVHILFNLTKYPPRNEVPWEVVLDELHHILKGSMS
jgi:phosphopantothenoylcysteine decarboxylase